MAESEAHAKEKLFDKIIFHKIEKANDYFNKSVDFMDEFLDMLKKK